MSESGLGSMISERCTAVHTHSKEESRMLIKSSLKLVDIKQNHCFIYDIEKYKNNEYVLQPYFAAISEEILAAVKKVGMAAFD
jgi:hypothetical protein